MAQIVGSAVVSEAVSKLSSLIAGKPGERESAEDKAERLEMAVLKIRTAVEVSEDWKIPHPPLFRWKAKLKRVADEGDDILHAYKKQILESEHKQEEDSTTSNSFRRCIARAAKRFLPFGGGADEVNLPTVRRYERLADSSDSFFRFVESGGRAKRGLMLFQDLVQSLMAGETIECSIRMATGRALVLLLPWWLEHAEVAQGRLACLTISYQDDMMWERNTKMTTVFRLSEAIDVLGITRRCLELLPPQFGAAAKTIKGHVHDLAEQGRRCLSPSPIAVWYSRWAWKKHSSIHELSRHHGYAGSGDFQVPEPVVGISARCYLLPLMKKFSPAKGSHSPPLELQCHLSPHFTPERHSKEYEEVEPHMLRELLPEVIDGVYHDAGVSDFRRQLWCPRSSMYVSMAPVLSPPLTIGQLYLMENPDQKAECSQK